MTEQPDPSLWEPIKTLFAALLTVLLSVFGWASRRQVARIDALEAAEFVSREEFDRMVRDMREEFRQGHRETHKRLDELLMHIAQRGH